MIFRRRDPADRWERLRLMVWPRRSFSRSARYFMKRVLRLSASPHAVALGVASGTLASFTPFMGIHFGMAVIIAWILRASMIAAALGTAVGNPLTFPLIWAATYNTGEWVLNARQAIAAVPVGFGDALRNLELSVLWQPLLKPMLVGGVVIGLPVAILVYVLTRWATGAFQARRRTALLSGRPVATNAVLEGASQ